MTRLRLRLPRVLLAALLMLVLSTCKVAAETGVGQTVDDFALLDQGGHQQQLSRQSDVPVLVLYSYAPGCPIARQDIGTLDALATDHADGVRIWLIDATPDEDLTLVRSELQELGSLLTVVLDRAQLVIHPLGITRTGEAVVIDTATWTVRWRGPVDDRLGYGSQKAVASQHFLADAITALLAHRPPAAAAPRAKGCAITLSDEHRSLDYATDIAPLIEGRCVQCHCTAGVAPFALTSNAAVLRHAAMIREVVRTRRMPPWQADAPPGTFLDQGNLSDAQSRTLVRWIESAPTPTTGADPLTRVRPQSEAWPLGKPDLVVDCPPQHIPANGVLPYQRFEVGLDLPQDCWVRGYDLRPSQPKVMHHAFAFIVKAGEQVLPGLPRFTGLDDFFANYVPGNAPAFLPDGTAKLLPKGSHLAFQIHYTTDGVATVDHPRLALYFLPGPPAHELKVASARSMAFIIPPGQADVPVAAFRRVPVPITLYALSPHMHTRGSWMTYTVIYPDGHDETLLSVPHYDFNWQFLYRLATPKQIPAGSRIEVHGGFDNSPFNELNPDPTATVRWGQQSWDEMFIGYVMYTRD